MNRSACDFVVTHFLLLKNSDKMSLPPDIRAHIEECPTCRALVETREDIRHLVDSVRMDPLVMRRLQVHVLARHAPKQRSARRFWLRLSPTVIGIALLFAVVCVVPGRFIEMGTDTAGAEAVSTLEDHSNPFSSAMSALPVRKPYSPNTDDESKMVTLSQETSLWMKKGTAVDILSDTPKLAKARVRSGHIVVDIRRHPPGFRFVVETPSAEVTALGTVFAVEISPKGEETVRVVESAVWIRAKNDETATLVRAGEQVVIGKTSTVLADALDLQSDLCLVRGACRPNAEVRGETQEEDAPLAPVPAKRSRVQGTKSAFWNDVSAAFDSENLEKAERLLRHASNRKEKRLKLLFRLANAYRTQKRYARTVSVYEFLLSVYPKREAVVNTLVSIAQLKQGAMNDPAGAVYYYDEYLKKRPRGNLAEAAGAGKVRALFALKKWNDVLKASNLYLHAFPDGLSRQEVAQKKERAEEQLDGAL